MPALEPQISNAFALPWGSFLLRESANHTKDRHAIIRLMGSNNKTKTGVVSLSILAGIPAALLLMASPVQAATQIVNGDIAYSAPSPDDTEVDIYTVKPDGTGKTNLTPASTGNAFLPHYSPDGSQLIYTDTSSGNSSISKMNADGSGKTDISGDGPGPAYSQESAWSAANKISFQRTDGTRDLWVMNPDGTGQVNVTNGNVFGPRYETWNADGTKLYFGRGSTVDIYSVNPDGTGLAFVNSAGYPQAFSPNGQKVLYILGDSGSLVVANSDFTNPVQLSSCDYSAFAAGDLCVAAATFSPDNLKIALMAFLVVDPNDFNTFQVGLFTMNINGTNRQLVASQSLAFFGDISGVSWQAVTQNIPDPTPTPGGNGSGSGTGTSTGLTRAAVSPVLDPVSELPKAGMGSMTGAYAGAVAAYGAYRMMRRKRWDIRRSRKA